MEGIKENIENLTNTKGIEDFLIGISYWLAVIVVVLLIFYVCIKIYNFSQQHKGKKPFKGRDDFLS